MDRRRDARFEVELKCKLRLGDGPHVAEGTTINMSRSGALIEISGRCNPEAIPRTGDILFAELQLPSNLKFGQRCLSVKGVAVRTEDVNLGVRVAVCFHKVRVNVPLAPVIEGSMAAV